MKKSEVIKVIEMNIENEILRLKPIQENYSINLFHIQVLKIQLRPTVKVGFTASKEGLPVD